VPASRAGVSNGSERGSGPSVSLVIGSPVPIHGVSTESVQLADKELHASFLHYRGQVVQSLRDAGSWKSRITYAPMEQRLSGDRKTGYTKTGYMEEAKPMMY
jgi:hypothetical protein